MQMQVCAEKRTKTQVKRQVNDKWILIPFRGAMAASMASQARLPCVGPRAVAEAKRPRYGGGPWVGGVMRWQFAAASQRPPPRRKRCKTGVEGQPRLVKRSEGRFI